MNEQLTRRDEMSLAGAALRGAPWKPAAMAGATVAGASFVMGMLLPGPADVSWALSLGITVFTLVAAIGAVARPGVGDRVTRQARQWSLKHPFRFALYPAAGAAILFYPIQLIFDNDGVFGAAFDSVWGAALVWLMAGLLALPLKNRARRERLTP
ncbi:hypothetical protein Misp01_77430 [Microtetraspora sp. NBRC 13810]|uniref:hypothetical protein n=1 Tax=Microtetraspora sp. NBRC 13810 TaxID=3030990 RepID=UPI0024A419B8|nr:hypothetical protein [Microtetraspora sp. NBRC 13810]GLW12615.1 hypothetical protein Misp01_77430 [Microtetraspora sp. NBRC 13810]